MQWNRVSEIPDRVYDGGGDLWRYSELLRRRWLIVVGVTVVAVLGAAVTSFFILPPMYEATVGIVLLQARTQVAFEPRIRTELPTKEDLGTRRAALQALATSPSIAARVLDRLQEELPTKDRQLDALLNRVSTSRLRGDLLEIRVRHTDPELAANIANAWAQVYVEYVNELFRTQVESPAAIAKQVTEAEKAYRASQEALVQFLGDNHIQELQLQINALEKQVNSIKDSETTNHVTVLTQPLAAKRQVLESYYNDLVRIEQLLADARALRKQLKFDTFSSSAALGDALAVIFLRSQVFAAYSQLPVQLQISLAEGLGETIEQQDADIAALISVLESRREETKARIDELSAELSMAQGYAQAYEVGIPTDDAINQLIEQYLAKILRLQAQLEQEKARKRELTQARDLAWETYETLSTKQAEVKVAAETQDEVVRQAFEALPPEDPISPKKAQNMVLAGTVGLMLGVFSAFVIEARTRPTPGT